MPYFIDDADSYTTNECVDLPPHLMPAAFDKFASAIVGDGNFGEYHNSSGMFVENWLDKDLVLGGNDFNSTERRQFVAYKGHGQSPDLLPPPNHYQGIVFPLPFYDQLTTLHCGPVFSVGSPSTGYQSTAALGRAYSNTNFYTSHLALVASCVGQPRLLIGTAAQQSLGQAFGFAFSPSYLSAPGVSTKLENFYMNSGVVGNVLAWADAFDNHPNQDGSNFAGPTAATFALPGDNLAELHAASQSPPRETHMLRLGQKIDRKLPNFQSSNVRVKITMNQPCRIDSVCGAAMIDEFGNGACPVNNSSQMPLEGTPTRTLTSALDDAPVGTRVIGFKVARTKRKPEDVADIAAAVAQRMTEAEFTRSLTLGAVNASISRARRQYFDTATGEGIALWYLKDQDRLRMIDYLVQDQFGSDGTVVEVGPKRAAEIAEEWFGLLAHTGKPKRYWNYSRPVIGEIAEIDAEVRLSSAWGWSRMYAYTVTLTREVNGIPFVDQAAKMWIHRSGEVILADVVGSGPRLVGEPGYEAPIDPTPLITILVTRAQARTMASALVAEQFGVQSRVVSDVLVYRTVGEQVELVRMVDLETFTNNLVTGGVTVVVPVEGGAPRFINED